MTDRRSVSLGLVAATAGLVACAPQRTPPAGDSPQDAQARVVKPTQCLVGLPTAPKTTLLAVSLHCDATRAYFRDNRERLANALLFGEERVLLTHLARTENEVPVAVELLRVEARQYPEAMFGALGLAARMDEPLSLAHVKLFIADRGYERITSETDEDLRLSVYGTRRLFSEVEGVSATPYIKDLTA